MGTALRRRRIAVLGEMSVTIDGEHRPVTAPRQRSVLAHLALEPGLALSADRLLEAIWGDDQPSNATNAVAFQIAKLRDALEPDRTGHGTLISTTSAGYVLDVAADEVDIHDAAAIIADAARTLDDDPVKAATLAMDALVLFRGEPFADVPASPAVDDERLRLELLHLNAMLVSVEARLALGEHAAVLPDVSRLANQHPLDERVAGLHLRTLDACGRTADALRSYAELRERLVEQLGIDPSPELQQLELALLGRPVTVPAPAATRSSQAIALPFPATSLVGRDDEAAAIARQLTDEDCRALTLHGPGGVGKTRLAIAAASQWARDRDDPVWWCALDSLDSESPFIDAIADAVGLVIDDHAMSAAGMDDRNQLLDHLSVQSGLLVIDNAEHLAEIPTLVADIAERCAGLTQMITSRERLSVAAEWVHTVDGLEVAGTDGAAATLFTTRARQVGGLIGGSDLDDIQRVCRATDGLPLALELGAAMTPLVSVAGIADRLEAAADSIKTTLVDTDPRHRSLQATFESSWVLLDSPLQDSLSRLAVLPAPFDAEAAREIAAAGASTLERLSMKSLIRRTDPSRFDLHPLIRQLAAAKLADDRMTRRAHSAYYLDRMTARTDELLGSPRQREVVAEADDEIEHVRAGAVWLAGRVTEAGVDDRLVGAAHALSAYGFVRSILSWSRSLTALADRIEAELGPGAADSPAYVWTRVYHSYPDAMMEGAGVLALMQRLEPAAARVDPKALAWCLMNQAICLEATGDVEGALALMERAAEVQCDDDPLLHAAITSWHGWELNLMGRHEEAAAIWERGLDHATRAQNKTARAYALSKVGIAADDVGDHELALHCHEESVAIFEANGDNGGLGYTLSRISWSQRMLGNTDAAIQAAEQGLECFQRVNHRWGIGASLGRIAHAKLDAGRHDEAAEDFAGCISWGEEKDLVAIVCYGLIGIAMALVRAGEEEAAVELCAHNRQVAQNPYGPAFAAPMLTDLESTLDPETFAAAKGRGEKLSLDQAKAVARGWARRLAG